MTYSYWIFQQVILITFISLIQTPKFSSLNSFWNLCYTFISHHSLLLSIFDRKFYAIPCLDENYHIRPKIIKPRSRNDQETRVYTVLLVRKFGIRLRHLFVDLAVFQVPSNSREWRTAPWNTIWKVVRKQLSGDPQRRINERVLDANERFNA